LKKIELKTVFIEYNSLEELLQDDRDLILLAKEAADTAYAPYSKFHVGAALRLENGICIKGSNQENVAYPSGLCAERVAMFTASTQYPGMPVTAIAITAKTDNFKIDTPITPCGSCRQVLAEYEHLFKKPIRIILTGETGSVFVIDKIEDLLPLGFKADELKK